MPGLLRSLWQATARAEAACRSSAAFGCTPASWNTSSTSHLAGTRRSRISRRRRSERCVADLLSPSSGGASPSSRVEGCRLSSGSPPGRSRPLRTVHRVKDAQPRQCQEIIECVGDALEEVLPGSAMSFSSLAHISGRYVSENRRDSSGVLRERCQIGTGVDRHRHEGASGPRTTDLTLDLHPIVPPQHRESPTNDVPEAFRDRRSNC